MNFKIILLSTLFSAVSYGSATTFAIIGDFGKGTSKQYAAGEGLDKYCEAHDCKFGITVGDNFYERGVTSITDEAWQIKFEIPYRNLNFTFFAALGNHDYVGNEDAEVSYHSQRWSMPAKYYSFEKNGVAFFAIDTVGWNAVQAEWLAKGLKETAKTKIVYGHYAIYEYTNPGHPNDTARMESELLPIMNNGGAKIYISGHEHDVQVINRHDIVQIICGNSGEPNHNQTADEGGLVFRESYLGFCAGQISKNHIVFKFIDSDGKEKFSYTIPR